MSRSYKKYPIMRFDGKGGAKEEKARANRHFRRCAANDEISGKFALYRRYYDSWNIHDEFMRWTKEKAEKSWEYEERLISLGITDKYRISYHLNYKTKRRFMNHWKKRVLGK